MLLCTFVGLECRQAKPIKLSHIKDQQAYFVLGKALESAGGLEGWSKINRLRFNKKTTLYDAEGNIESQSDQVHNYHYHPQKSIEINWQDSAGSHQVLLEENHLTKYLNENLTKSNSRQDYLKMAQSSEYVVSLPFKLADHKIVLTYEGIDTLSQNRVVHSVKAKYEPDDSTTYDATDVWWHYFTIKDFKHAGYTVQHKDHISLVVNTDFVEQGGFIFPGQRNSYRLDSDGNITYLRAKYTYDDFIIHH